MTYPGGKNGAGVYQRIICQLPPHTTYIEGFLGSGAIMRLKKPAIASIGIDADSRVMAQARAWACDVPGLELVHADAIRWLASHDLTPDTLIYLDPPYLMETRRGQRSIYRYELTDNDHARLLATIVKLDGMIALSGYWSEMYADTLKDWRSISFTTTTRGGSQAREWLWMNYPQPTELHDYRYLGDGYRERERIKRKKQRWTSRLQAMPALERYAMFASIEELRDRDIAAPETAMEPESSTPEQTDKLGRPTPEMARVHDIAPPDLAMLDRGAPVEVARAPGNASADDGRRQASAAAAIPSKLPPFTAMGAPAKDGGA